MRSQATAAAAALSAGEGVERGGQAEVLGQQPARQRAGADGEGEDAGVDAHGAAALGRLGDVREHDLAGGQGQRRAGAGHEAAAQEQAVVDGERAQQVAEDGDQAAQGQRAATADAGRPGGRPAC